MSTDNTFYENGLVDQNDPVEFNEKQWVYGLDQNSGVYSSGQVQFDLSSLSNSKGFINWAEGYLSVPIVATVKSSTVLSDTAFALAMKNGYYQLINSASIKIGNQDVNNKTDFTNLHIIYKVLSSMSYNDLLNAGSVLGVWPDTPTSAQYSTGAGLKNNVITTTATDISGTYITPLYNDGLYKRALLTSFQSNSNISSLVDSAVAALNYRNYTDTANTNPVQVYILYSCYYSFKRYSRCIC